MSTQDEYSKKSVHKLVDNNRNIKKVIIPHSTQIGKKTSSVNKDTVSKISGSSVLATLTIRDDTQTWNRLELNNGKSTGGNSIKFCSGGEKKADIYNYNSGDLVIRNLVDDIYLTTSDDIYLQPGNSTKMTINQAGAVTIDCEEDAGSYGLHINREGASSSFMIKLENKDASSTAATAWGIFHQDDGDLTIGESYTDYKFHIQNDGFVGIGTSAPDSTVHIYQAHSVGTGYVLKVEQACTTDGCDGIHVSFSGLTDPGTGSHGLKWNDSATNNIWRVYGNGSGGSTASESFTGCHDTTCLRDDDLQPGMIVESSGEVWYKPIDKTFETGLPKTILSHNNGSSKVFGVVSGYPITSDEIKDDDLPYIVNGFLMRPAFTAYGRNAGVLDTEIHIAVMSVGEGVIWLTDINGEIQNGDYIETSVIKGLGRRQDDDIMRSKTVAKCTETIDWATVDDIITYDGANYKRYLAMCTFHCG